MKIFRGQPYADLDLRVDDHADPLREIRRLMLVADERYTIFKTAMPTTDNFSGMIDRRTLDRAIEIAEEERRHKGYVSVSHAT